MKDLKSKAFTGAIWSFAERISLQLFQFVITLILARLLGPEEFGIVALTNIFIALSIVFVDSGFTKGLIRKKDRVEEDENTVFVFNLIISVVVIVIINIFAGTISTFYNSEILESVLRVFSLNLLFFALYQIHQVRLIIEFNFKKQFQINLISAVVSGSIGIILAVLGYGVWSLVFQYLINNIVKTCLLWSSVTWVPSIQFSRKSFKQLYAFSINLFFNDLLKTTFENGYGLVIGKVYSEFQLGLYSRGSNLPGVIISNFQLSIQKVTFPLFSKYQDNKAELNRVSKQVLNLIFMFVIPSMFLLYYEAETVVLLLLTRKWIDMVPIVKLFCIYWVLFPFYGINNHIILSLGYSRTILIQNIVVYSMQMLILFFTYNRGIEYVVLGLIISSIIRHSIVIYYSSKLIQFGYKDQLWIFLRTFLVSVVALAIATLNFFVPPFIHDTYWLLPLHVVVFFVVYFGIQLVVNKETFLFIQKSLSK